MCTRERSAFSDSEYERIESAVMETARGRWFLAEHARRHRLVETEVFRALLERLETILRFVGPRGEKPALRHAPPPNPPPHVERGFNFESFLAAVSPATNLTVESPTKDVANSVVRELNASGIIQAFFDHRGHGYVQQIALGSDRSESGGSRAGG